LKKRVNSGRLFIYFFSNYFIFKNILSKTKRFAPLLLYIRRNDIFRKIVSILFHDDIIVIVIYTLHIYR